MDNTRGGIRDSSPVDQHIASTERRVEDKSEPSARKQSDSSDQHSVSAPDSIIPACTSRDPGDIEEGRAAYRRGGFHPVYIGDMFHGRYEVLNKIGYGVYSTVWLVRDHLNDAGPENAFRALKVLSAQSYGQGKDTLEKEILIHLRQGDCNQIGYAYVCHLLDDFQHHGPNGTHMCLIFELMGETLRSFGSWFFDSMVPESVMRRFTIQLLLALDFAHEHQVIHTDIKPDNIFVKFRDHTRIESGYLVETPIPKQFREEEQYSVVSSQPLRRFYFNEAHSLHMEEFDIALGDWGVSSWESQHLTENIQPIALRSPEVLIGAPWNAKTDWWNLGGVVLEVFRAVRMFSGRVPPDGHYELKEHLAEIVNLFGSFPMGLLGRGNQEIVRAVFDSEGRTKEPASTQRLALSSEAFTPGLSQETRDDFVSFLQALMIIDPVERLSTLDLLRHPWLGALQ